MSIALGILCILHGVVHLLYAGHAYGIFEMQRGMVWPAEAWIAALLKGLPATRVLATVGALLGGAWFMLAGVALIVRLSWGQRLTLGAAIFSSLYYVVLWNGRTDHLPNQGAIGVGINLVVIALMIGSLRTQVSL